MMKYPKSILTAVTLLFCLIGFHPAVRDFLAFEPSAEGQLWTWLTSHWVHWNASHLFWSASTFLFLLFLWPKESIAQFVVCCALCSVAIPLGVLGFAGHLPNYGGLSGIDSGLFVLFVTQWMRERRKEGEVLSVAIGAGLLFGFAGKVLYETLSGGALFAEMGSAMTSVPIAHLAGGLVGWLCTIEKKWIWWHHSSPRAGVILGEAK